MAEKKSPLPHDPKARKAIPITRGLLDYFPAALAAVAEVSRIGNDKHNPGQPIHHSRGKSNDHADAAVRHLMERGGLDEVMPGVFVRHTAEAAWRLLALLQEEIEAAGEAPLARGARLPDPEPAQTNDADRITRALGLGQPSPYSAAEYGGPATQRVMDIPPGGIMEVLTEPDATASTEVVLVPAGASGTYGGHDPGNCPICKDLKPGESAIPGQRRK